jgi:GNAT superfamily N-acetyltransferase
MSTSFEIRAAAPEDVPHLLALIRALADYERLTHLVATDEAALRAELFGERPVIEALIAWADGSPAGFAIYFQNYSTFLGRRGLYLEDLFVRPEHRGKGFGKALLVAVARIAHARGAGRFEWMALDWNKPAIDFYKGLGAAEMGEWRLFRVTGEALARLAAAGDG